MNIEMAPLCEMRRTRVRVADIAFDPTGGILVVTSDGSLSSPIRCHRIELKRNLNELNVSSSCCVVTSSPVASFFMRCHTDVSAVSDSSSIRVTHVRYVDRNGDGHTLLVGAGDQTSSHIELWQLTARQVMLHRYFQPPETTVPSSVQVMRCSVVLCRSCCFVARVTSSSFRKCNRCKIHTCNITNFVLFIIVRKTLTSKSADKASRRLHVYVKLSKQFFQVSK